MTPTRDARIRGPALQEAHRRVGRYLATEFLPCLIGLEEHATPHVQKSKSAIGYRLANEDKTLIVALMRGGLPLAEGVNETFPSAGLLHANHSGDITRDHLAGRSALILVDSVINKGATVQDFVKHVRRLHVTIRIVVVAGVVQAQSVTKSGPLWTSACEYGKFNILALRLSENMYTGRGTTDTGNCLYNTTCLE